AMAAADERHAPALVRREEGEHGEGGQRGHRSVLPRECHRDHLLPPAASPSPRRAASGRSLISLRLSRRRIRGRTDAPRPRAEQSRGMKLDLDSAHELWRMQLLDELRRKRVALDYEPQLDPEGR